MILNSFNLPSVNYIWTDFMPMNQKHQKYALCFLLLFAMVWNKSVAQAPIWSNQGALVSLKGDTYLSLIGDAVNARNGIYNNSDTIFLTGDWINDAGNRAFDSIGTGWVYLYAADQRIRGNDPTHFENLVLKNAGVKYGDLAVYVDGKLILTDRELSMDTHTVFVTNPSPYAVERTTGYVSALADGGLQRKTAQDTVYYYPVGSNVNIFRFRPVELTPTSAAENQFRVRFANTDPTNEGFDRETKFHLVCKINPDWYHRIAHPNGSDSAQITLFYDTTQDGNWNDMVHWQNVPQWESMFKDTLIPGTPFNQMIKTLWSDFSYTPFALAITSKPFAVAGVDTIIWREDTIRLSGCCGIAYDWTPEYNIGCTYCSDPLVWPQTDTLYRLTVENDLGCFDYDSVKVLVRDKPFALFFIPNVITPNADGFNDFWFIRDLQRYPDNEVRIINRWGDEILFQKPYANDWAGTWNGKELPGGTYYYILKVKNREGEEAQFDGPLTVVR